MIRDEYESIDHLYTTPVSHYRFNCRMYGCYWTVSQAAGLKSKVKGEKKDRVERREREAVVIPSRHPASLPQMTPRVLVLAVTIIIQQEWRTLFDICQGNLVGKIEQSFFFFLPSDCDWPLCICSVDASRSSGSIPLYLGYKTHSKACEFGEHTKNYLQLTTICLTVTDCYFHMKTARPFQSSVIVM